MNKELFDKLNSARDIDPDKHDGSYELVQKTVEAYASMDSLNSIDYKDFELLYYMVVGTWKIDIDRKKKAVSNSNLPDKQKKDLILLIDKVQQNANDGVYENSDANHYIGMFGAGFQSVVGAATIKLNNYEQVDKWNQQIRDFISMLVDISQMDNDEEIFDRAESVFSNGIRGLQAGTASQILHCLKPKTFPILNSVGRKGYSTLGVFLQEPSELKNYIINCRSIKRFRDVNFAIKNYRTFDRLFWEVVGKINFEGIIDFLRNYGGKRISVSAPNHDELYNLGKNACNEFNEFCQTVFDKKTFVEAKKAKWQNSGAIREYLWYVLKYEKQKNLPYSISISLEKVQGEFKLIVKLELEKGRTPNEREMFNTVAIASELSGDVKYILYPESVSGGEILNKAEAIAKLKSHNSDRVCPVFVLSDPYIMSRTTEIADEAIEAVDALTPLYDSLIKGNIPTKAENEAEQTGDNKVESNKIMLKNIILYGPPGTGKTYNTVRKAVEIIEPDKGWGDKDYKAVKEEYDKLLNDGKINFVTFHQSYGYEEFIEGIKPSADGDNVTYDVEPGVFLKFCDSARTSAVGNNVDHGFNSSPTIWKVSLERTGDNKTRTYCLNNGCVRVGFDSYGENIVDDTDFKDGGKNVLNAFINDMRVGDIVLSCYTNTTIDGVGVVTGDYEWHNEFDHYKRLRKVKWIYRGKKDIVEINGNKTMTLSTVYRLNNITLADVLKIVEGDDNEIKAITVKPSAERGKYVFIIDEINRGNISKIFGELITLIEDNKREGAKEAMSVKLPYSHKAFSVPDNVYIIGTMNTADRSIAAIDTALRRRFTFIEMMPDYKVLDGIEVNGKQDDEEYSINIAEMLKTMNERIAVLYDREHTVGHAYFMALKDNPSLDVLSDIFRNKIIPLLQEYFYEDYGKIRLVLGDNQKEKAGLPQFIECEDIDYNKWFGSTDEYELGERSKKYSKNEAAFGKSKAYIGIYNAVKEEPSTPND